jgi:hypothetical protein
MVAAGVSSLMDLGGGNATASASVEVNPDEQTQMPSAAVATPMCREWCRPTETSRERNQITSCEYELALAQYRRDDTQTARPAKSASFRSPRYR